MIIWVVPTLPQQLSTGGGVNGGSGGGGFNTGNGGGGFNGGTGDGEGINGWAGNVGPAGAFSSDGSWSSASSDKVVPTGFGISADQKTLSLMLLQAGAAVPADIVQLAIQDRVTLSSYSQILLFTAGGRTVLVDPDKRRFVDLGLPLGKTVDIRSLATNLASITYDGGKFSSSDDVVHQLMSLPLDVAGPIAQFFASAGPLVNPSDGVPIFLMLAGAGPSFLSEKLPMRDQVEAVERIVELLRPDTPSGFSPNPDNPTQPEPNAPKIPKAFWPFPPLTQLRDPKTGIPFALPHSDQKEERKQADAKEKEDQQKQALEKMLLLRSITVSAPSWLATELPGKDPNLARSSIVIVDSPAGSEMAVLSNWCKQASNPATLDEALNNEPDILIAAFTEDNIRSDPALAACLNASEPSASIAGQLFGYDGLVLLTRTRSGGPWSPGELAMALSDFISQDAPSVDNKGPNEKFVVKPAVLQCRCISGDKRSWIKKLADGWLNDDPANCVGSPGDDHRIRCAGLSEQVQPAVEVSLPSLFLGAFASSGARGPPHASQQRAADHRRYCDIDPGLNCLAFRTYAEGDAAWLPRFIQDWCSQTWPGNEGCKKLVPTQYLDVFSAADRTYVQKKDLIGESGGGIFVVALRDFVSNYSVSDDGVVATQVIADSAKPDDGVDPGIWSALAEREHRDPLHVLEIKVAPGDADIALNVHTLLQVENPYVARLFLFVKKSKLNQLPVASYIRFISDTWAPSDGKLQTFVPLSVLRH
ncbi:DUF1236 domain-containing protein [Mesorhizobium sp. M0751]|uniref:hypothetical protein n=1 Tax=unclassified Mesorhizobium TaxID=325217 RepID=UPI003335A710